MDAVTDDLSRGPVHVYTADDRVAQLRTLTSRCREASRPFDEHGYLEVGSGLRSLGSSAETCLDSGFDESDLRDLAHFRVSLPDWLHPKIAAYAFRPESWQEAVGKLVEESAQLSSRFERSGPTRSDVAPERVRSG